jgi:hypothetical protein
MTFAGMFVGTLSKVETKRKAFTRLRRLAHARDVARRHLAKLSYFEHDERVRFATPTDELDLGHLRRVVDEGDGPQISGAKVADRVVSKQHDAVEFLQRSSGRSPVCFARRASIFGPISTPS